MDGHDRDSVIGNDNPKSSVGPLWNSVISAEAERFLDLDEIKSRMNLINDAISDFIETALGEDSVLHNAARHLLQAGGKRLRSLIVLLACEATGGKADDAIPFAIATEILQTTSLIHDDYVDEDVLRRGVETTHEKFGKKMALLAGDLLIAQAIKMFGESATPEMLIQVGTSGIKMCEGEAADFLMSLRGPANFTTEAYLQMVELKTATFMEEAVRIGANAGNPTEESLNALMQYGKMLGYAFQIRDDTLNIISSQAITGKSEFSDIENKRFNFVLTYALESSSPERRGQALTSLEKNNFEDILNLIEETNAISHANELAAEYIVKAKSALEGKDILGMSHLKALADFILVRDR
ncbi:MAG: polyprenyl synthetase family protein [Candidatus Hodarchaeota archaeon]